MRKLFIAVFIQLVVAQAFSQVNFDRPFYLGANEKTYESVTDKNVIIYLPSRFEILSTYGVDDISIIERPYSFEIQFAVGPLREEYELYKLKLKEYLKANKAPEKSIRLKLLSDLYGQIKESLFLEIPQEYKPQLAPMINSGWLGSLRFYKLTLVKQANIALEERQREVLSNLFEGNSGVNHIGGIDFYYSSQRGGEQRIEKSRIEIVNKGKKTIRWYNLKW